MEARELRITLDFNRQEWALALNARSEVIGDVRVKPKPLPFSAHDLSIFERALDLNAGAGLKRLFRADELERLTRWDLLRRPPDTWAEVDLSGRDLYRDRLRERVRALLARLLIEPGAPESALRRAAGAERR